MDSSTTSLWTGLFSIAGCLASFYYYYIFVEIPVETPVIDTNSVDLDQTLHTAVIDLGLHCLAITL